MSKELRLYCALVRSWLPMPVLTLPASVFSFETKPKMFWAKWILINNTATMENMRYATTYLQTHIPIFKTK